MLDYKRINSGTGFTCLLFCDSVKFVWLRLIHDTDSSGPLGIRFFLPLSITQQILRLYLGTNAGTGCSAQGTWGCVDKFGLRGRRLRAHSDSSDEHHLQLPSLLCCLCSLSARVAWEGTVGWGFVPCFQPHELVRFSGFLWIPLGLTCWWITHTPNL